MRCESNQIIDDFSIRREILNMFKISWRIWIVATVSSEGGRRRTKSKTTDNYDLLSITIENEFLKNAIRWPLRGLFQAIRWAKIGGRRGTNGENGQNAREFNELKINLTSNYPIINYCQIWSTNSKQRIAMTCDGSRFFGSFSSRRRAKGWYRPI
jgi:hypothetical protein